MPGINTSPQGNKIYYTGGLAYYDAGRSGLVKVKVLRVLSSEEFSPTLGRKVEIKVTANRGAYKRGDILTVYEHYVPPRNCVYVRNGMYRIRTDFAWYERDDEDKEE